MTLQQWLRERGMTAAELIRRSGVSRSLVYKYIKGTVKPRYANYRKLRRVTGDEVDFESFHRPPRRRAA